MFFATYSLAPECEAKTKEAYFLSACTTLMKILTTRAPPRPRRRQLHNDWSNPNKSMSCNVQPHTTKVVSPAPLMQPALRIWASPLHPLHVLAPLVICQWHKMRLLTVVTLDMPIVWQRRNSSRRRIMVAHEPEQKEETQRQQARLNLSEPKLLNIMANR